MRLGALFLLLAGSSVALGEANPAQQAAQAAYLDAIAGADGTIALAEDQIGKGPFDADQNGNPLGMEYAYGDLKTMFEHFEEGFVNLDYIATHEGYRDDLQQLSANLDAALNDPDPELPQIPHGGPHYSRAQYTSLLYDFGQTPGERELCVTLYNEMANDCNQTQTSATAKHLLVEANRLNEATAYVQWYDEQGGQSGQ